MTHKERNKLFKYAYKLEQYCIVSDCSDCIFGNTKDSQFYKSDEYYCKLVRKPENYNIKKDISYDFNERS